MQVIIRRECGDGGCFSKKDLDTAYELVSDWYGSLSPAIYNHRSVKIEEILVTPEIVDVFNMGMRVAIKITTTFGEINFSQCFIGVIVNKRRRIKQQEFNQRLTERLKDEFARFKDKINREKESFDEISLHLT